MGMGLHLGEESRTRQGVELNILQFSSHCLPGYKGDGPIKTIENLIFHTKPETTYCIITRDRNLGDTEAYTTIQLGEWKQVSGAEVFYSPPGLRGLLQILKILLARKCRVAYINSFFSASFSLYPTFIARLLGQKLILAPRGKFSNGALRLKSKGETFLYVFITFLDYTNEPSFRHHRH